MIRAYHVIFSTYGFWLPNDPWGSWSDFVRSWEIYQHGRSTKTYTRWSVAAVDHDRAKRQSAKSAMQHEAVRLSGVMARSVGSAFAESTIQSKYRIHACSIMPDHIHMVIGRHDYRVEQIVRRLKQAATTRLREEEYEIESPSPWARGLWKVFLDDVEAVRCAVEYVEQNPVKAGLQMQRWKFVTPYVE